MDSAKLKPSQINRPALLRDILADAVRPVPEAKRAPPLMACLAEQILALAAGGEADPATLRHLAIEKVKESCPGCRACDGLQLAHDVRPPPLSL